MLVHASSRNVEYYFIMYIYSKSFVLMSKTWTRIVRLQSSFLSHVAQYKKFDIATKSTTQGLPYDFGSVMQLEYTTYSKNGLPTIIPIDESIPRRTLGKGTRPSQQDYLDINLSYCGEITFLCDTCGFSTWYIQNSWTLNRFLILYVLFRFLLVSLQAICVHA